MDESKVTQITSRMMDELRAQNAELQARVDELNALNGMGNRNRLYLLFRQWVTTDLGITSTDIRKWTQDSIEASTLKQVLSSNFLTLLERRVQDRLEGMVKEVIREEVRTRVLNSKISVDIDI